VRLDSADIEAIAQRVAELLAARPGAVRYVDAARVAELLGVEREWVYAHARQLGAIRLGGPQGRLRFDLHHIQGTLAGPRPAANPPRQAARPAARPRVAAERLELLPYQS
jgi:hypothetical protein